jgi:uncharacterized membrane protein YczE
VSANGLGSRMLRLYVGLAGFGVSLALMVRAGLGLGPWDVLHQGIALRLGMPIGWVVIAVSALVLLAWIPLRERPGFGTISNLVVVGLVVDLSLAVLPTPRGLAVRAGFLAAGIVAGSLATGLYIGAGMGAGPRDGLMMALARPGHSIAAVRTSIELSVLAVGFALGGSVGVGTIAYALGVGPLVQVVLPRHTVRPAAPDRPAQHEPAQHEEEGRGDCDCTAA